MPKRKGENNTDDKTRKKIAKLEKRLARYKEQENKTSETSDDEKAQTPQTEELDHLDPNLFPETDDVINVPELDEEDSELESDILEALGEPGTGTKQYGEKIHEKILAPVKNIIIEGLPKQAREKLTDSILIPSNCKLLDAPKLNKELLGVISNPAKTRDKLLQERQQEIGLAIAGVCQTINSLSKKDFEKVNQIKKLGDVSRILSNLHFNYTEIRRKLVNPFMDKNLSESLKDNKREQCLYSQLDDSVKSFSAMKRASAILKTKPITQTRQFVAKNYQHPPRRLNQNQAPLGRGSFRGGNHQRFNQRQPLNRSQDFKQSGPPMRGRAKYP